MALQPEPTSLTYEDLQTLPEDGNRYELFEGEIEVTPSPSVWHQRVVTNLTRILSNYADERCLGTVLVGPTDVVLSPMTVLIPDLLFVAKEHEEIIGDRFVAGPPDLVVEVLSPTTETRDRRSKMNLYARYGVKHYWLIDVTEQTVETYDLVGRCYVAGTHAQGAETLTAQPFPSLLIALHQVW